MFAVCLLFAYACGTEVVNRPPACFCNQLFTLERVIGLSKGSRSFCEDVWMLSPPYGPLAGGVLYSHTPFAVVAFFAIVRRGLGLPTIFSIAGMVGLTSEFSFS